ncbi:DUF3301 domain-containing protein [Dyella sp. ASV21]|jgi:hypothetical protein|uniref:DUF3301 domain-containing protein n=1 Tax=Dyella sp. ASV21 TaxID=2795114 RepID=UPI0018ED5A2A|nr:DUF3301 domain-containing protein [Dyella sp. ASV21]
MSDLPDLILLVALLGIVGAWLKFSRAREQAVEEARRQCRQHGLQLLDESVGLRSVRLRRGNGPMRLERCYSFEVSIDGDDREPGRLWMIGHTLTGLSLPTIQSHLPGLQVEHSAPPASDNVVPLRRRLPTDSRLH